MLFDCGKFPQAILITPNNEKLFTFVNSFVEDENHSELRVYDATNLNLLKTIDITNLGINQTKYYIDDNYLFFSNPVNNQDMPSNILGILNINDYTFKK